MCKDNEISKLDSTITGIRWVNKRDSYCSMIKEGTYPEGTTRDEIEKLVKGTFGGIFIKFGGGKFRYLAYTD